MFKQVGEKHIRNGNIIITFYPATVKRLLKTHTCGVVVGGRARLVVASGALSGPQRVYLPSSRVHTYNIIYAHCDKESDGTIILCSRPSDARLSPVPIIILPNGFLTAFPIFSHIYFFLVSPSFTSTTTTRSSPTVRPH